MGKLNPEFEEFFSEGIINKLHIILEKVDISVNSEKYLDFINRQDDDHQAKVELDMLLFTPKEILEIVKIEPNKIVHNELDKYFNKKSKRDKNNQAYFKRFSQDLLDFIEEKIVRNFLDINEEYLKSLSRQNKENLVKYGIEVFKDQVVKYAKTWNLEVESQSS